MILQDIVPFFKHQIENTNKFDKICQKYEENRHAELMVTLIAALSLRGNL